MRAGLLSDRRIIRRLNRQFVCTSIIIDDLQKRAAGGNRLAKELLAHWEYPVEMMFLTAAGAVVSRLNSYKDFPGMHPDVSAPPGKKGTQKPGKHAHREAFLSHLARHFGAP